MKNYNFGGNRFDEIAKLLLNEGKNVLIDAPAGTGKTTFARLLKEMEPVLKKSVLLTAVTGVADNNLGGVTVSSRCHLSKYQLEMHEIEELAELDVVLSLADILVIDEISMYTLDQLMQVDVACRAAKGSNEPFGGIRLLLMGDYCQLEPIDIKDGEVSILVSLLEDKSWLEEYGFVEQELTTIYRQKDQISLRFLSELRSMIYSNKVNQGKIDHIQKYLLGNSSKGIRLYSNVKDLPQERFLEPDYYYYSRGDAPYVSLPISYGARYLVTRNLSTDEGVSYFNGQEIVLKQGEEENFLSKEFSFKKINSRDRHGNSALRTVVDQLLSEYIALLMLGDMTTRRVQGLTLESGQISSEFFSLNNRVRKESERGWLRTLYTALGRFVELKKVSIVE